MVLLLGGTTVQEAALTGCGPCDIQVLLERTVFEEKMRVIDSECF